MVLHLGGCGRVGHRHNTPYSGWGPEHDRSKPHPSLLCAGPPAYTTTLTLGASTPRPYTFSERWQHQGAQRCKHARIVFACVSALVFSYEALDPVLCRLLSDERVLAGLLPQMALESFIRVIRYSGREPWIVINQPLRCAPCFCLSVSIFGFGLWILCFFAT